MPDITRHLKQVATYWACTGEDGFGGFTFAAPVTVVVRWEDHRMEEISTRGEQFVSAAKVYTLIDVADLSYMCLGDQTVVSDPRTLSLAYQVRNFSRTPDLRNLTTIRCVILGSKGG